LEPPDLSLGLYPALIVTDATQAVALKERCGCLVCLFLLASFATPSYVMPLASLCAVLDVPVSKLVTHLQFPD